MPATVFPSPVSNAMLRQHFSGLQAYLTSMVAWTGQSMELIFEQHARTAQETIEEITRIPFFETHYCTHELARQKAYTIGVEFDRYTEPMEYNFHQWWQNSGRTEAPYLPVKKVDLLRLTLHGETADSGKIVDMPDSWLTLNNERGFVHILPTGGSLESNVVWRLFSIYPLMRPGLMSADIPCLVNLEFTAGLVAQPENFDGWDPDTAYQETIWWPEYVNGMQVAIAQLAAAPLLEKLANEIDRGGASVSMDGLSESVNPEVIFKRADSLRQRGMEWANEKSNKKKGPVWVFA